MSAYEIKWLDFEIISGNVWATAEVTVDGVTARWNAGKRYDYPEETWEFNTLFDGGLLHTDTPPGFENAQAELDEFLNKAYRQLRAATEAVERNVREGLGLPADRPNA